MMLAGLGLSLVDLRLLEAAREEEQLRARGAAMALMCGVRDGESAGVDLPWERWREEPVRVAQAAHRPPGRWRVVAPRLVSPDLAAVLSVRCSEVVRGGLPVLPFLAQLEDKILPAP
mmetsp:Transcript_42847/g.87606  ORF Transcript_42847/g.87606 Transcript_42847/m.87606 type:complete len:117 (+) Transcript_42847:193-543(+)